jgi:hypothetical protein
MAVLTKATQGPATLEQFVKKFKFDKKDQMDDHELYVVPNPKQLTEGAKKEEWHDFKIKPVIRKARA